MEYAFIEMTPEVIKEYRSKFVKLPPQQTSSDRIVSAIENGIPIEYLVSQGIITKGNIKHINLDRSNKLKVIAYMKYRGVLDEDTEVDIPETPGEVKTSGGAESNDIAKQLRIAMEDSKDKSAKIKKLEKEISVMRRELEFSQLGGGYYKEGKEDDKEVHKLFEEIGKLNKEIIKLGVEKKEYIELNNELKEKLNKSSIIGDKVKTPEKVIVADEDRSTTHKKEIGLLKGKVKSAEMKLEAAEKDKVKLKEKILKLEGQLTEYEELEGQLDGTNKIVLEKTTEIKKMGVQVKDLERQLAEALEDQLVESDKSTLEKDTEIKELGIQIKDLEGKLVESEELADKLEEKLTESDKSTLEKDTEIKELSSTIKELELNKEKNYSEIELIKERIKATELKLEVTEKAKRDLEEEYTTFDEEKAKLRLEIENITLVTQEKITEITELQEKISNLENQIIIDKEDHAKQIKMLNELTDQKIQEYRNMVKDTPMERNKVVVEQKTSGVDIARARIEGKKIVSVIGNNAEDVYKYVEVPTNAVKVKHEDDADIYIITTDITKPSVDEYKGKVRDHYDNIKVLVNWDESIPFTPESVLGGNVDVIANYDKDWYKETWTAGVAERSWVKDLNRKIVDKLGGGF